MLPAVTRTVTAAVTALALMASTVAPAQALGKNERNFLKGVAAAVIVNEIVKQGRAEAAPPRYAPYPGYDARYGHDPRRAYDDRYGHKREPQRQGYTRGYYSNAASSAFYEYSPQSRRVIQQRLAAYGYYRGAIDGVWGQGTASAMSAYARDVNASASLGTRDGSVRLYNALIG